MTLGHSSLVLVVLGLVGCASTEEDPLSWEEFQAQAYREPDTGVYVVNGDELAADLDALRVSYEAYRDSVAVGGRYATVEQPLIVNLVNGRDDRWSSSQAGNLTYCVSRASFGSRYNAVKGQLSGMANDVSVDRWELGGGWFVTPNVLAKAEWVTQTYNDFPTTDIRSGGRFRGLMLEGTVAF